jgi:hypothetical protein
MVFTHLPCTSLLLASPAAAPADFLEKTIGHFYSQGPQQASPQGQQELQEKQGPGAGSWEPKSKAAFLQTPQDFFNVDAADPMVSQGCVRYGLCLPYVMSGRAALPDARLGLRCPSDRPP